MTYDKGQRPVIGRLYRPARLQTRLSDGTFSSYNAWLEPHEERLQTALLYPCSSRGLSAYTLLIAVLACAYLVACA